VWHPIWSWVYIHPVYSGVNSYELIGCHANVLDIFFSSTSKWLLVCNVALGVLYFYHLTSEQCRDILYLNVVYLIATIIIVMFHLLTNRLVAFLNIKSNKVGNVINKMLIKCKQLFSNVSSCCWHVYVEPGTHVYCGSSLSGHTVCLSVSDSVSQVQINSSHIVCMYWNASSKAFKHSGTQVLKVRLICSTTKLTKNIFKLFCLNVYCLFVVASHLGKL